MNGGALRMPGLLRRTVLAAPGATVALAVLAAVLGGAGIAVPALLDHAQTAAVQHDLTAGVRPGRLDVVATSLGGPATGPRPAAGDAGGTPSPPWDPAVDAVWGADDQALRDIRSTVPPVLDGVLGAPRHVVTFPELFASPAPGGTPFFPTSIALAVDPDFADEVTLVDGRLPDPAVPDASTTGTGSGFDPATGQPITGSTAGAGATPSDRSPVEIALAAPSAETMQWALGETRQLAVPDGGTQAVTLTGTFTPNDPADSTWANIPASTEAEIEPTPDGGLIAFGSAFANAASWPVLSTLPAHSTSTVWLPIDRDAVTASNAAAVADAIRVFTRIHYTLPAPAAPSTGAADTAAGGTATDGTSASGTDVSGNTDAGTATATATDAGAAPGTGSTDAAAPVFPYDPPAAEYAFTSALPDALDASAASTTVTAAFLTMTASGPAIGILALLVLVAGAVRTARSSAYSLLAARGASARQLTSLLAGEGLLAGISGAAVGGVAGVGAVMALQATTPATAAGIPAFSLPSPALMAVGLLAAILLPAIVLTGQTVAGRAVNRSGRAGGGGAGGAAGGTSPAALGLGSGSGGDSGATGSARTPALSAARLALEALLALVTAAAVVDLLQHPGSPDALGSLVPALLALCGCALAARVFPLLLRAARRATAARRGAIGLIGAARAAAPSAAGVVVVVCVLVGLAVSLFSAAFLSTVHAGVEQAAVEQVGADVAVSGPGLTTEVTQAIAATPGVEASAAIVGDAPVTVTVGSARKLLRLVVTDTTALARVQQGLPGAITLPDAPTGSASADADASGSADADASGSADADASGSADADASVSADASAATNSSPDADANANGSADADADGGENSDADANANGSADADANGSADAASPDPDAPIPVIASDSAAALLGGEEFALRGHPLTITGRHSPSVAFTAAENWLLVDSSVSGAVIDTSGLADLVLVRLADDADPDAALAAIQDAAGPDAQLITPQAVADAVTTSPRVATLTAALIAATGVSLLLAVAAIALSAAAGRRSRGVLAGVVGALGVSRRQVGALAVWEVAPPVVVAGVLGVLTGILVPFVVLPSAGASALTAGTGEPPVVVDPLLSAAIVAVFAVAAAATVALSTRISRPRAPGPSAATHAPGLPSASHASGAPRPPRAPGAPGAQRATPPDAPTDDRERRG